MKGKGLVRSGVVALVLGLLLGLHAEAQQAPLVEPRIGKLMVGVGLGLQGGTADGTAFAIGLHGDYFLTQNLSVGPLLQLGLTDDLTQVGFSVQAKYTFDLLEIPELKPHVQAGLGFIHADLDRRPGPDEDDTAPLVPIGFGAEYRLTPRASLSSTLLFNFTDLSVGNDDFHLTWLIGTAIRF